MKRDKVYIVYAIVCLAFMSLFFYGCNRKPSARIISTRIQYEGSVQGAKLYAKNKDTLYLINTGKWNDKIVIREVYPEKKSWRDIRKYKRDKKYISSVYDGGHLFVLVRSGDALYLDKYDLKTGDIKVNKLMEGLDHTGVGPLWQNYSDELLLALNNNIESALYVLTFSKAFDKMDTLSKVPISANLYYGQAIDTLLFFEDKSDSSLVKWTPNTLTHFRQYRHIIPRFLSGGSLFANDEDKQKVIKIDINSGESDTLAFAREVVSFVPFYCSAGKVFSYVGEMADTLWGVNDKIAVSRDNGNKWRSYSYKIPQFAHKCEVVLDNRIYVYAGEGSFLVIDN